jgi:lysozyme
MSIAPNTRPRQDRKSIEKLLAKAGVTDKVALVGIRGYYSKMGPTPGNDRGLYDDAMFVVSPSAFASFNANTDPSIFRPKIATLRPGLHIYKKGKHGISRPGGGYPALRPANKNEALPVYRDGVEKPWDGIAINIHKGGYNSTSSEGCQTIYPDQWNSFINLVYGEMDRYGQKTIPYLLVEASS